MKLTILGSGTALSSVARGCPGYLVEEDGHSVALDFGSGSLRQLAFAGLEFHKLDALLLTHAHIDHCGDLASLLFARRNPDLQDRRALTVAGWEGFEGYYDKLVGAYGRWITDRADQLNITEVQELAKNGLNSYWTVEHREMDHIPGALGLRLTSPSGKSLVYSGDTDFCQAAIDLAGDADVLILECSFPDELKVKGHLTPSECGKIATESGCRELILSHFYPPCDEVDILAQLRKTYQGPVRLATDLMIWDSDCAAGAAKS